MWNWADDRCARAPRSHERSSPPQLRERTDQCQVIYERHRASSGIWVIGRRSLRVARACGERPARNGARWPRRPHARARFHRHGTALHHVRWPRWLSPSFQRVCVPFRRDPYLYQKECSAVSRRIAVGERAHDAGLAPQMPLPRRDNRSQGR